MQLSRSQGYKTKQSGGKFVFSTLSFIVILAALVFGMSVFFRVSNIEVTGAKRYSQSEIIAASGLKAGTNLMLLDRSAAEDRIYARLLYVGSVTVSRRLPNTVVITVDESSTFAAVDSDSGTWIVDRNGRVIDKLSTKKNQTDTYITVSGLKGVKPQKGQTLAVSKDDEAKLAYLRDLLAALSGAGISKDVSALSVDNSANPEMTYMTRFKVRFGRDENLESKLSLLAQVVSKLDAADQGTIDLSQDKKAYFSPD